MNAEVALGRVKPPNFKLLFTAIGYKQWLRPEIPAAYLQKWLHMAPKTSGGNSWGGGASSKRATEGAGKQENAHTKQAHLRNPSPHSELVANGESLGKNQ
jgi:hypothetical protein